MTLDELTDPMARHVGEFKNRRVLVLGDAMLDEYLVGDCSRISPEAPVPVLRVNSARRVLGGAANTAANVVSLGGRATLIALVGSDEGGQTLRRCASDAGIDLLAVDHGLATLRKTRVVGQQQQIVRLDYEEIQQMAPSVESEILGLVDACVENCDIVVISDYAKGFLSESLSQANIRSAH
jgi:D-beta-D-heptose 7-phosphate kinase/D-beta-D-heptose 1-phosphate adenosyltransferase